MSQLYGTLTPCGVSTKKHNPTTHPWTINSLLEVPAQSQGGFTTIGNADN